MGAAEILGLYALPKPCGDALRECGVVPSSPSVLIAFVDVDLPAELLAVPDCSLSPRECRACGPWDCDRTPRAA